MRTILAFLLTYLATQSFAQNYQFVKDSFPIIERVDSIDLAYMQSIDTALLKDLNPIQVVNKYFDDQEGAIMKRHILGQFNIEEYCFSLIVIDFLKNGTNGSRFIELCIYDQNGEHQIKKAWVAKYVDLMHTYLIEECYIHDDFIEIINKSKSTRLELNEISSEKIYFKKK